MMKRLKIRGFTLIELLISITLFTSIATIIISILFISLRANKKSEVIVGLKQSGNNALSQMVSSIRFARSLDDPPDCVTPVTQKYIKITALDYGQTEYGCPGVLSDVISSNSADLVDPNAVIVRYCSFTCSQTSIDDPPTITIQFFLTPANQSEAEEAGGEVPFNTSVTLRNYSR